jgi:undecaprenyl-diphosphatase
LVAFELIEETVELALIVAFLYLALGAYLSWKQPAWARFAEKRRFTILLALVLVVGGIKVGEDVVNRESGPVDVMVLQFIHAHVPATLTGLFEAITVSGSSTALVPLALFMVVALLFAKRRFEALLIAVSAISGALIVYGLKAVVGRVRPSLWDTEWYWGSSFPSGHTLVVAALATATAISVKRIWPPAGKLAVLIAVVWVVSVGFSRLALGVHWPTDVLVAACIGMFLPLAIGVALESWHA